MNSGALHTAGGLVFQGLAEGYLVAYDAATGERLWSAPAGGTVRSAPSTVMADGKQYIVVASGNVASAGGGSAFSDYSSVPRARSRPAPARVCPRRQCSGAAVGGDSTHPRTARTPPRRDPGGGGGGPLRGHTAA